MNQIHLFMAKIKFTSDGLKIGRIGDKTQYIRNGEIIIRERHNAVTNKKGTLKQLQLRTRLKNIIEMYKAFEGCLKDCFFKNSGNQTDYCRFISVNIQSEIPVYLTKKHVDNNACVAAPYQISEGKLDSIIVKGKRAASYTNIMLGGLQIDENTTIGNLSSAIIKNNTNFTDMDEIWYFSLLQGSSNDIPYVHFALHKMTLNRNDKRTVWDAISECGFSSRMIRGKNRLAHGKNIGAGVFAWMHVRFADGIKIVSTQSLINNNAKFLSNFSTSDAFQEAAKSYGFKITPSVISNEDGTKEQENLPVTVACLRIVSGSTPATAIGSVDLQENFIKSDSMSFDIENGNTLALEIKGTNLDCVQLVEIRLEKEMTISLDTKDISMSCVHTDKEIIVGAVAETTLHSSITEIVINGKLVWQTKNTRKEIN